MAGTFPGCKIVSHLTFRCCFAHTALTFVWPDDTKQSSQLVSSHLACQVNACQHDILGVMVKGAAAKVEAFEERKCCSLHFRLEAICSCQLLAELLHLGLVVFAELGFILKRNCSQLLACAATLVLMGALNNIERALVGRQGLKSHINRRGG